MFKRLRRVVLLLALAGAAGGGIIIAHKHAGPKRSDADPAQPVQEIQWQGIDSGYRGTTVIQSDGSARNATQPAGEARP